jgi:hypothetical protein
MQQALRRSSLVPAGFVVESAFYEADKTVFAVRPSCGFGLCPSCKTVSRRVPAKGRSRQQSRLQHLRRCHHFVCGC